MAETKTSVARVRFHVDEEPNRRSFILVDQEFSPDLPILRSGTLRLDLTEGATRREAEDLADLLNARIHALVRVGLDPAENGGCGRCRCADRVSAAR